MVLKMDAYRSNTGQLFETWEEAAAQDAIPIFKAIGVSDDVDAYQAAGRLFVEENDEQMIALELLATLLQQKPQSVQPPNVVPINPGQTTSGRKLKMPSFLGGKP